MGNNKSKPIAGGVRTVKVIQDDLASPPFLDLPHFVIISYIFRTLLSFSTQIDFFQEGLSKLSSFTIEQTYPHVSNQRH
jgi:hypothetical protein